MWRPMLTVSGWTMASRILGFARDMLIAARLGAGPVADAFFVALKLPNLFRRLFGEGAFSAAFIPAFAEALVRRGWAAAQVLAERMGALLGLWLLSLTVAGLLFMPAVLSVLAPGFRSDPPKFALAVELTRITLGYLPLICLAALISGVLNGLDRFAAAAAAPVVFNLFLMAALVGLTPYLATPGHALAWGVLLSGVAQLALVWFAAHRAGMALNPFRRPRLEGPIRTVLARLGPALVGAGVTQLNLAIDVVIASFLPSGAVSHLYYADRVAQLPLGVIGAALATTLLPLLSRELQAGRPLSAHRAFNRGFEIALLLSLPSATGLAAVAGPLIVALFERGAFDALAARASAAALIAYAIGLPAFVLLKVFAPVFFSRGDTVTPVRVGIMAVLLNLGLNLALIGPLGHVGIALATSVAAWANVVVLAVLALRRGWFVADRRSRRVAPRLIAGSLLMGGIVAAIAAAMPLAAHDLLRLLQLGGLIGVGIVVYSAALMAWRIATLRDVMAWLRQRPRATAG